MITPIFKVDQDEQYVYVTIRVINVWKLSEMEIYHDCNQFIFYARPYHLRLEFSGELVSSDSIGDENPLLANDSVEVPKILFESETNQIRIPIKKKCPGEHFRDLDLIGNLLAKQKTKPGKRLIEVLRSTSIDTNAENADEDNGQEEDNDEFDWTLEQTLPDEQDTVQTLLSGEQPYGFGNSYRGIIGNNNESEAEELFDLKNPGRKTLTERRKERLQKEMEDFDEEHYLADLYDADDQTTSTTTIQSIIESIAPWTHWHQGDDVLTEEDRQRIIDHLPRKDFDRFDSPKTKTLILGLCDIIYAYCYDLRTNDWEHCVESSWTIRKLSPTFSWFEFWSQAPTSSVDGDLPLSPSTMIAMPDTINQNHMPMYMLICCIRRSLIYPLYRNWKLSMKVANDVIDIVSKGRNAILKCLLDMHRLMANDGENGGHLINQLYLNDYCVWIQRIKPDFFQSLVPFLRMATDQITKSHVGLDLVLLESAAQLALEEEDQLSGRIKSILRVSETEKLDSDDDDD